MDTSKVPQREEKKGNWIVNWSASVFANVSIVARGESSGTWAECVKGALDSAKSYALTGIGSFEYLLMIRIGLHHSYLVLVRGAAIIGIGIDIGQLPHRSVFHSFLGIRFRLLRVVATPINPFDLRYILLGIDRRKRHGIEKQSNRNWNCCSRFSINSINRNQTEKDGKINTCQNDIIQNRLGFLRVPVSPSISFVPIIVPPIVLGFMAMRSSPTHVSPSVSRARRLAVEMEGGERQQ